MVSQETINEAVKRLAKFYNPLKIYLYGDYAHGIPNEESSVRFLIVVAESDEEIMRRSYLGFEILLELYMPKNIVVFTQKD